MCKKAIVFYSLVCAVISYSVVQGGVVECSVCCSVPRYDAEQFGAALHSMAKHIAVHYRIVQYNVVWHSKF